jgi:WD40 repeat protein
VEQVKLLRQLGPTTVTAQGISGAVPSPDGRTLAVYDVYEERFELWDATTSQVIMILETNVGLSPLYSVIFSPDGQMLASFSRNFVQTWDSATGQLIQSFPIAEPGRTYGIAFRPDGVLVASTGDHLQLWDVASGKTIVDLGENISPPSYEFVFHPTHPDILAWERNQDVQVWNIATGELIQTIVPFDHCWPFECEPYGPARLAFSPDGQRLVILYTDGVLETWDWKNGQGQQSGGGRGAYPSLAFSPLAETQLLVTSATHYADGNQDIDGHISFRVYSEASGTYEFVGETIVLEDQEVMSVAFSPDGRYVYAAVRDAETALTPIGGRVYVFGVGP